MHCPTVILSVYVAGGVLGGPYIRRLPLACEIPHVVISGMQTPERQEVAETAKFTDGLPVCISVGDPIDRQNGGIRQSE